MFLILTILFAIAILLGGYLLFYLINNKNTPKGVVIIHGSIAGTGLILLLIFSFYTSYYFLFSFVIFLMAAMGGFYMFYRDLTGKSLPKWLAVGHGMIALIGFASLIAIYYFFI